MTRLDERMGRDMLDRIRAGDEAALSELLDREWAGLVRSIGRRLPAGEDAQDAAQEAFVRLWERRESWHSDSARGLLYRIAINVAEDASRRADVRRRGRTSQHTGTPPPTPADEVELDQARARFHAALAALAPRRREVFRLVRYEGMTYAEVADALDLSAQTVANHMSLALRELRAALADVLPVHRGGRARQNPTRSNDG